MDTGLNAFLDVLFIISFFVFVISVLTFLVARFLMKRQRLASKSAISMYTSGTMMTVPIIIEKYIDGAPLINHVLGVIIVIWMLRGMHRAWKNLKMPTGRAD